MSGANNCQNICFFFPFLGDSCTVARTLLLYMSKNYKKYVFVLKMSLVTPGLTVWQPVRSVWDFFFLINVQTLAPKTQHGSCQKNDVFLFLF